MVGTSNNKEVTVRLFGKTWKYVKKNPGKVVLGILGVAGGVATGGFGIAILGTAFGVPTAGTATITGVLGIAVGRKVDKKISS
jgi:hypothetical protein